ncbi:MAG: hypothetical protein WCK34_11940 [Bacteroidota bacterium]
MTKKESPGWVPVNSGKPFFPVVLKDKIVNPVSPDSMSGDQLTSTPSIVASPVIIPVVISGSVGLKGDNNKEDVEVIQNMLIDIGILEKAEDPPYTNMISAIKQVQLYITDLKSPDGLIQPGNTTLNELNKTDKAGFEEKMKVYNNRIMAEPPAQMDADPFSWSGRVVKDAVTNDLHAVWWLELDKAKAILTQFGLLIKSPEKTTDKSEQLYLQFKEYILLASEQAPADIKEKLSKLYLEMKNLMPDVMVLGTIKGQLLLSQGVSYLIRKIENILNPWGAKFLASAKKYDGAKYAVNNYTSKEMLDHGVCNQLVYCAVTDAGAPMVKNAIGLPDWYKNRNRILEWKGWDSQKTNSGWTVVDGKKDVTLSQLIKEGGKTEGPAAGMLPGDVIVDHGFGSTPRHMAFYVRHGKGPGGVEDIFIYDSNFYGTGKYASGVREHTVYTNWTVAASVWVYRYTGD